MRLEEDRDVDNGLRVDLATRTQVVECDPVYEVSNQALSQESQHTRGEHVQGGVDYQVVLQLQIVVNNMIVVRRWLPELISEHLLVGAGNQSKLIEREIPEHPLGFGLAPGHQVLDVAPHHY